MPTVVQSSLASLFMTLLGIGRGVARLPLDATADTGLLVAVDWLSAEHCVDRGTQIEAGHRLVVAGPTVVELPSIDQPVLGIKEIEVWGAGSFVGFRDFLGVRSSLFALRPRKP